MKKSSQSVAEVSKDTCGGLVSRLEQSVRSVLGTGIERGAVRERVKFIAEIFGVAV